MFREHLSPEPGFRWRGGEITRLEAFSDAVFAFAVTLLVVSLEVPHTFAELKDVIRGFPAFAICFAMLLIVWHNHAKYFRRYGLQDPAVQALNGALLFVVLFYVYPLKFLFTMLVELVTRGATSPHAHPVEAAFNQEGVPALMAIYGLGYAAVSGLFTWLYRVAYRRRGELDLDDLETLKTRQAVLENGAQVLFGLVSTLLALSLPTRMAGLAGWVYMLVGPYFAVAGKVFGKQQRLLRESLETAKRVPEKAAV